MPHVRTTVPFPKPTTTHVEPSAWPRLLSRERAAQYLSVSDKQIDRLIAVGAVTVVRLPAVRHTNGASTQGESRRVLLDRAQLDALVDDLVRGGR